MSDLNSSGMDVFQKTALAAAVTAACQPAIAQDANDQEEQTGLLEEVIVTGTRSTDMTVLESSIAVTTINETDLLRQTPRSTVDALELIPGVIVEATGGEVSNNYTVRGLAGGGQQFVQLLEDGLPVKYRNALVDTVLKQDVTIGRVEAVRGGTSSILTVQGAGAAINFITRKPGDEAEGTVRLTGSTYNTRRAEFWYGAPIGGDWFGSVGGYYRSSDSVRDTGFTADRGGIFKGLVEKRFDDGTLGFTFKVVDENNTFLLPTPFENFADPREIAGFDALEGTLLSLDNAVQIGRNTANSGDSPVSRNDLTEGFATKATQIGFYFDKDLTDSLSLNVKSRYIDFDTTLNAVFNVDNGSIVQATDRVDPAQFGDVADLLARFAPDGAVAAGLAYVSDDQLLAPGQLANLNGNGLVTNGVSRSPWEATREFVVDVSVDWETDRNFLTVGALLFDTRFDRGENGMNTFLSEVTNNPRRLDIVALDAANNVVGFLTEDGVLNYGAWGESAASESTQSTSFYVNNEYQVNDDLRIDFGVRVERLEGTLKERQGFSQTPVIGAFDADGNDVDNIIANNFILGGTGTNFRTLAGSTTETTWTLGGNYVINDNLAVYGRYVDAFNMRAPFDTPIDLSFGEFGVRYQNDYVQTSLTAFMTDFKDFFFSSQAVNSNQVFEFVGDYEVLGAEFELEWQPTDWFNVNLLGVFQDAELSVGTVQGFASVFDGNEPQRLPPFSYRLTPSFNLPNGQGEVYLTYQTIDDRFADVGNSVVLPGYDTLNAGVIWYPTDNLTFSLNIRNLTDEIGLTEGNPRGGFVERPDGSQSDVFLARSIVGRNAVFSITYDF